MRSASSTFHPKRAHLAHTRLSRRDAPIEGTCVSDSSAALAALAQRYRLIIVSNVHRAGFAGSNLRLQGDFAAIITAEDVGAYKPADNHFVALDRPLGELGIERSGCCTSRRACSTITCPRVVTGCHRYGSTAATIGPVGARRTIRARSTRTRLEVGSMGDFAAAVDAAFSAARAS
jgi:putative hydrolase of the HAD superfamily